MKLLAFDTSGLVASVALLTEETVLAEYTVNYKKTHSQTLLPMIDEILTMLQQDPSDLDAVAVASGPGSFTGLRIGSATAKGLGLALDLPLIPVPSLEGLACNFYDPDRLVCPMMDARRNQVYTGLYHREPEGLIPLLDQKACPVEEILMDCCQAWDHTGRGLIFCGDGLSAYEEIVRKEMESAGIPFLLAPAHLNRQRAASVGMRALELYRKGIKETADQHVPVYLRKPQAERELEKKRRTLLD